MDIENLDLGSLEGIAGGASTGELTEMAKQKIEQLVNTLKAKGVTKESAIASVKSALALAGVDSALVEAYVKKIWP